MNDLVRLVGGRQVPAAGTWDIDRGHTSAAFAVRHLFTRMRGRFTDLSGTITIADDPTGSTVHVIIQAASITTGNDKADESLRAERYLDVERFPTLEFVSTAVVPVEHGDWSVTGDLTIRGITRPVELATTFIGAATSPLGEMKKMSFESTGSILREDYGMSVTAESPDTPGVWIVGNTIDLTLDVEANRAV